MPLYMQSSIKVGPYRFDASQPGAELSSASKGGSRPDAHFIKAGPGGFHYQRYVKAVGRSESTAVDVPTRANITQWFDVEMIEVASGDVLHMRNEQFGAILDEINAKVQSDRLASILPTLTIMAAVIAGFALRHEFFFLVALALPLWLVGRWLDSYRRVTVLLYELSEGVEHTFAGVTEAFDLMMNCSRQWRIEAGGVVRDLATWKRNAGASHVFKTSPTSLCYKLPEVIASNITPPALQVGSKVIYFFPDVALIQDGQTFGAVGYADLSVTWQISNSTELDVVPDDAVVVGWVWEHPNKDGGPDRRFRDNRQIPICSYEALHIGSASGVNELVEFSRLGVARAFADAIRFLPRQSVGPQMLAPYQ